MPPKPRIRPRAFTVAEMLVAIVLFGFLATISFVALQEATQVWRKTSSRDQLARSLTKAWSALRRDLESARQSASTLAIAQVPASLAGADGDAVCFLSPVDQTSGDMASKADGSPFMMTNIIYYLVVPQNHDLTFGTHCSGAADAAGYDVSCPHKVLMRLTQDNNPTAGPANSAVPASENTLWATWTTQLTRPASLGKLTGNARKISAANLLTFRLTTDAAHQLITVELRAVAIEEAQRHVAVGTVSLGTGAYTVA